MIDHSSSEDFLKLEATKPSYLSFVDQAKEIICLENLGAPFLWETFGPKVEQVSFKKALKLSDI